MLVSQVFRRCFTYDLPFFSPGLRWFCGGNCSSGRWFSWRSRGLFLYLFDCGLQGTLRARTTSFLVWLDIKFFKRRVEGFHQSQNLDHQEVFATFSQLQKHETTHWDKFETLAQEHANGWSNRWSLGSNGGFVQSSIGQTGDTICTAKAKQQGIQPRTKRGLDLPF